MQTGRATVRYCGFPYFLDRCKNSKNLHIIYIVKGSAKFIKVRYSIVNSMHKRVVCGLMIIFALVLTAAVTTTHAKAVTGATVNNVYNKSIDIYATDKVAIKIYTAMDGTRIVLANDLDGNAILASIIDSKGTVLYQG